MREFAGYVVIVDISGYTGFLSMHRTSMAHAEQIITDLMEGVLDASSHPLVLDKLQGDAAIFYAEDTGVGAAPEIAKQVLRFFEVFDARERELVSCNMCICDACNQIGGLKLKAVLHRGDLIVKEMGGSTELGGVDVILSHRLLKNSIDGDSYILMTKPFHAQAGDLDGLRRGEGTETTDLGPTGYVVFFADPPEGEIEKANVFIRAKALARMEYLGWKRMLKGKDPNFTNLPTK